jgi:hypothetical protein
VQSPQVPAYSPGVETISRPFFIGYLSLFFRALARTGRYIAIKLREGVDVAEEEEERLLTVEYSFYCGGRVTIFRHLL